MFLDYDTNQGSLDSVVIPFGKYRVSYFQVLEVIPEFSDYTKSLAMLACRNVLLPTRE